MDGQDAQDKGCSRSLTTDLVMWEREKEAFDGVECVAVTFED